MDKDKFQFISDLRSCQREMLDGKSKALEELYDMCDNEEKASLVKQLLVDFSEMDDEVYSLCLEDMSRYIVNKGFPLAECMVVAMCHDHLADISQEVLQNKKSCPKGQREGIHIALRYCCRYGTRYKDVEGGMGLTFIVHTL